MTLEKFSLKYYEQLVSMYYRFTVEVYPDRKIGYMYSFYRAVNEWIEKKHDIVLAIKDGYAVGFTVCFVNDMGGITEPVYVAEFAYVEPEYRNTRAGYLLYKNAYNYSKDINMKIVSMSRIENGVDKMVLKHFDVKPKYIMVEGE